MSCGTISVAQIKFPFFVIRTIWLTQCDFTIVARFSNFLSLNEESDVGASGLCSDTLEQPVNTKCMTGYIVAQGRRSSSKICIISHSKSCWPYYVARAAPATTSPPTCFRISLGAENVPPQGQQASPFKLTIGESIDRIKEEFSFLQAQYNR